MDHRDLGVPFGYSIYVPGYFDNFGEDYSYGQQPPPAPPAAAPPQPVIINQYFAPPPQPGPAPQQLPPSARNQDRGRMPGDPIGPVKNYYLIAYKDHTIYTVLSYWLEGNTLHYVTTDNTHNQASLNLIDLKLTKWLNRDQNFSIPGH